MKASIIAILFAAAALPAVAQTATPRADTRPAAQAQVKEDQGAGSPASVRERARAAKAQRKKDKQLARQREDVKKKAPAS